jgi:hypothetical protein
MLDTLEIFCLFGGNISLPLACGCFRCYRIEYWSIATAWINAYGSYAGTVFGNASTTGGLEPFPYVSRLGLSTALASNGYGCISPGGATFELLAIAWSNQY